MTTSFEGMEMYFLFSDRTDFQCYKYCMSIFLTLLNNIIAYER